MSSPEDNARRLQEVSLGFSRRLPERISRIVVLWNSCKRDGDKAALPVFRAEVHKLKGTAATYGYVALSLVLADIESILIHAGGEDVLVSDALAVRIEAGITALRNRDWTPDVNPGETPDKAE